MAVTPLGSAVRGNSVGRKIGEFTSNSRPIPGLTGTLSAFRDLRGCGYRAGIGPKCPDDHVEGG